MKGTTTIGAAIDLIELRMGGIDSFDLILLGLQSPVPVGRDFNQMNHILWHPSFYVLKLVAPAGKSSLSN